MAGNRLTAFTVVVVWPLFLRAVLLINAEVPDECYNQCGLIDQQNRIMGGTPQSSAVLPFMAAIDDSGYQCYNDTDIFVMKRCSGFIVAKNKILTSAHCVVRSREDLYGCEALQTAKNCGVNALVPTTVERLKVHVGRGSNEETTYTVKSIRVDRRYYHNQNTSYDVAILTLESEIVFGYAVRPVCVASDLIPEPGTIAIVAGYGYKSKITPDGVVSDYIDVSLHETFLSIVKPADCEGASGDHNGGVLCATRPTHGIESGDSGGPLVVVSGGRHYAIGISSRGVEELPDQSATSDQFTSIAFHCAFLKANGIPCGQLSDAISPGICQLNIAFQYFIPSLLKMSKRHEADKKESYDEWYQRDIKEKMPKSPLDDENVFK